MISSLHLEGPALSWFKWMHSNGFIDSWKGFLKAINLRFGPSLYEDHISALSKLQQTTSIAIYQTQFEDFSTKAMALARIQEDKLNDEEQDGMMKNKMLHPLRRTEDFSDRGVSEPPNAEGTEDRTVVSPSSDPASFDPFSPAESPEKADLLSSASRLSLESSIALITEPEATSQSIGEGWNLMQPFPTLAEATKPPEVPCPFDPQSLDCSWRES
ncbi:hypothetical protein Acr_07g0008240 [Actinidia rufa]|uniref:Retrotransposon gag domain-containing protein n=1 Tax=Actinidia rufa TaxID=165716 RepID=A0A7J0EYD6_9ERIC|nr:hypothetical protein Acr_07g0008240 [Actinidia rufa]